MLIVYNTDIFGAKLQKADAMIRSICIQTVHKHLPPDVHLCEDGTVVHIDEAGMVSVVPILYNPNGKPYVEFEHESGTTFMVWLSREFYRAFRGHIPEGYEAYHLDGNRANLVPSNLRIRAKGGFTSKFKLAAPKGGCPPAA